MPGYDETHAAAQHLGHLPTEEFAAVPDPAPHGPPEVPAGAPGAVGRRIALGLLAVAVIGAGSIGTGWYLGRTAASGSGATPSAGAVPSAAASAVPSAGPSTGGPVLTPSAGTAPGGGPIAGEPLAGPASSSPTAPLVTGPLTAVGVARCTMKAGRDGNRAIVTYDVQNLTDGDPETAWRCPGHGRESVTFRLNPHGTVTVTEVALIPGYAKTDPKDPVDRFAQNYTVTRVRWSFTGGGAPRAYEQSIPRPSRAMARFTLPAPVTASTATMTILDTAAPTGELGSNVGIAVSEVAFTGSR